MAMATGAGKESNKYEWQDWPPDSLNGMPPKRRRLVVWALLSLLFVGLLLDAVLEAAGITQPWHSLLAAAVLAAVFGPLIRGAILEARQLRAEGINLPSYPVTRKTLITHAVLAGILWVLFAVTVAIGQPVFPLLPIAATIWLAYLMRRWKAGTR